MADPKRVYILKHVANEDAGTLADFMTENNIAFEYVNLYAEASLPADFSRVQAVIAMGGPMNVDEEVKHPFLKAENKFIQEIGKKGIPFFGVCLGSQLLAKAFGARVYKAAAKEVGWGEVTLTGRALEDRVFRGIKEETLPVLQWHEDTFDLPKGAPLLATNPIVPNQALRCQDKMYGFQFHIEVKRGMLEDWFAGREDKEEIVNRFDTLETRLKELSWKIYRNFFSIC